MKILVNCTAAVNGGALSILKDFYQYVISNDQKNDWIFLVSTDKISEIRNVKVVYYTKSKKNWLERLKFDLITGRMIINQFKPDIVFSLQNTIVYGVKAKQVIYVHQPLPFQKSKKFKFYKKSEIRFAIYQYLIGYLIKESAKNAFAVIVQTNWMQLALEKQMKNRKERLFKVFPELPNLMEYDMSSKHSNKRFFYPASNYLYKNHQCIYDACSILRNEGFTDFTVELTLPKINNISNIRFIGEIPFQEVMKKYNESTLIFPSYIETVGLPLVEARYMRAIILCADCDFAHEILDDYENAYFFDPFQPKELANLVKSVSSGKINRIENSKPYSSKDGGWGKVIEILNSVYDEDKS